MKVLWFLYVAADGPMVRWYPQILGGLGFSAADQQRLCSTFSGGWQMRIALAKLLLSGPDLLLLDEPTNHLDASAKVMTSWLHDWVAELGVPLLLDHRQYPPCLW